MTSAIAQRRTGPHATHIFDLHREIIFEILQRLATLDYDSIYKLSDTCCYFREVCQEFIKSNPPSNYIRFIFDDNDDEEDEDWENDYDYDYIYDPDDLDRFQNEIDRFSYGSNYDEDIDEFINGPEHYD